MYLLCVPCAILASIAFLYFNLTQWTLFGFTLSMSRFPLSMCEYPFTPTLYLLCVPCAILASIAFLYLNLTQWTQGSRNGRYLALLFPCPNVLWTNINSPLQLPHLSQFNPTQLPSNHLNTAYDLLLLLWGWYFCSFDVL